MDVYRDEAEYWQGAIECLTRRLEQSIRADTADGQQQELAAHADEAGEKEGELAAIIGTLAGWLSEVRQAGAEGALDATVRRHRERAAAMDEPPRFVRLCAEFDLAPFAEDVLMLALAAQLAPELVPLMHLAGGGDRGPTVGLAHRLFSQGMAEQLAHRAELAAHAPLRRHRLVRLGGDDEQGVDAAAPIEVAPAVADWLVGRDELDPMVDGLCVEVGALPPLDGPAHEVVASAARTDVISLVVDDPHAALAHLDASTHTTDALVVDAGLLTVHADPLEATRRLVRDARLRGRAMVWLRAEQFEQERLEPVFMHLLAAPRSTPLVLVSCRHPRSDVLGACAGGLRRGRIDAADAAIRRRWWQAALVEAELGEAELGEAADLTSLADRFKLSWAQVRSAAQRVSWADAIELEALFEAARLECQHAMAGLAKRVRTIHGWDDLVLPQRSKSQLRRMEAWMAHRATVHDQWGLRRRVQLGRGLTALFFGPSGTGKTMAAGILSAQLHLEMFRVDLSQIVSKYIGETEKNLDRVFEAADAANAVLFFDEADAIFGKRSEVRDAHDRYANIEVGYLLQRMEEYDGVAILATNLKKNLDEAFLRRIQFSVEFPLPSQSDRRRIWQGFLQESLPQDDTIDVGFLARAFSLTGGHIKNCVVDAAFAAADEGEAVGMRHLVSAVARELTKNERAIVPSEFGEYFELVDAS
ncbi:ATP-binding protein [Persicimonas caeni]|uniref:ATP-binding protein n=1 Tax=Persicimonas caeni TaxID=2292766 RepID=UPI00143DF428|nr:ATP-binding protein [Persicimonas caeni]